MWDPRALVMTRSGALGPYPSLHPALVALRVPIRLRDSTCIDRASGSQISLDFRGDAV